MIFFFEKKYDFFFFFTKKELDTFVLAVTNVWLKSLFVDFRRMILWSLLLKLTRNFSSRSSLAGQHWMNLPAVHMILLMMNWQNFCSFEERLIAQRKEREMATADLGFKKPLSKEEKTMKKKERLAAIGNSLSMW